MKRIMFLLLVLVLTACSTVPQSELSRNQAKWEAAAIEDYDFKVFISCFCAFNERMPLSIQVRGGEMVSMTYVDGTAVGPDDPEIEFFTQFATIDNMFAELTGGETSRADKVEAAFDPTYGYPTKVDVDRIKDAVDDEFYITVSDFVAVK